MAYFFSCPQSFPVSESFPIGWLVASGGQSIEISAAVLPINIQSWFHSRLTGLISLLSKGRSRVLPNTMIWRHRFFSIQPSLLSNSHIHTCVYVCVCVCVCVCVLVAQLCLTLCNPTDYSPPGFSVHGILQARILEWIAIPFSKRTSHLRDQTLVSLITGRFFTVWATGKSVSITDY